jgi:uncharacterized protein HemY
MTETLLIILVLAIGFVIGLFAENLFGVTEQKVCISINMVVIGIIIVIGALLYSGTLTL